jgi:TldD protein
MMFDILEKVVDKSRDLGATYVELRGEQGFVEYIQMDDSRITALTQRIERGVAIRVLADGAWGFVSTGNLDMLEKGVADATSMAKAAAKTRNEPIELAEVKAYEDKESLKVEKDPRHVPIEEKIQYMNNMTKVVRDHDERISNVTVKIRTASGEKFLVTSEGTKIQSPIMLVWSYPWVTGKAGTRLSAARYEEASTHQGWEYLDKVATAEYVGTKAAENVILQLEGVAAKGGLFPCVMGPRVVGTLAHEALGHLAEADLTVNSPFRGKRGEVVASEGVNMTDDGTNAGKVGVSKYDDEGVPSRRVEIIKDSVLKELLINREYAKKIGQRTPIVDKGVLRTFLWDTYWANKMGVQSTGNAKRNMRQGLVEIGFTNLVVDPGTREIEEIISEIDHGYYIQSVQGAHSANPESGDFSVVGNPAFLIKNGKKVGQSMVSWYQAMRLIC